MEEISVRQEMKEETGRDLRGNGVRNESRTLKEGEEKEEGNGGVACTPLLCVILREAGSAVPSLAGTEATLDSAGAS